MMNVKYRRKLNKFRKKLSNAWYKLMSPLAKFLFKREDANYIKTRDSITEEQAAKLVAKDLSKYIAKRTRPLELIVAEYVSRDDTGACNLSDYSSDVRSKSKIGIHKFGRDVDFQIRVLYELRKIKGIQVHKTDWQPDQWMYVKGFEGLYEIKVEDW